MSHSESLDELPDEDPASTQQRAALSSLMDGELDGSGLSASCQAWRDHASARRAWHNYQLIGDVLRSEELAQAAGHDRAFLAALRQRLIHEPVLLSAPLLAPLAPGVTEPRAAAKVARWRLPSALAAGLMAVAAGMVLLVMTGSPALDSQPAVLAVDRTASPGLTLATVPTLPAASSAGAMMIRDAQLDAYLNAHRATRAGGATALPGTGLRTVDAVLPAGEPR